jgi:RHS repeat-associated protein
MRLIKKQNFKLQQSTILCVFSAIVLLFSQSAIACAGGQTSTTVSTPTDKTPTGGDPVLLETGTHYVDRTELLVPGSIPIEIRARYYSNVHSFGHFGHAWQWDMDMRIYRTEQDGASDIYVVRGLLGEIRKFDLSGNSISSTSPRDKLTINASSYDLMLDNRLTYHFNNKGLLTSIKDRNNNSILIDYETENGQITDFPLFGTTLEDTTNFTVMAKDARPTKIYTNDGDSSRCINFTYNSLGYVATATDFTGRQYAYTYDSTGNLAKITDPQGNTKRFFYEHNDDPQLLTGYTRFTSDPDNTVKIIRLTYDSQDRVTEQIDRGYKYTFSYPDSTLSTVDTVVAGNTIHKITEVTIRQVNEYNDTANGYFLVKTITHTDTSVYFDPPDVPARSNIATTTIFRTINVNGQAGWDTIASGNRFNQNESYTRKDFAGGGYETMEYDSLYRVTRRETHLANGDIYYVIMQYQGEEDDTTRVVRGKINGDSSVITYGYDANSNIDTIWRWYKNDSAYVTAYQRDSKGRVTAIIDNEQRETEFQYDNGQSGGPGFMTRRTSPGGAIIEYDVDDLGRVTSTTDPRGYSSTAKFDSLGRMTEQVKADSTKTTWEYDGDDLKKNTEGIKSPSNGIVTNLTYDIYGRLLQRKRVLEDQSEAVIYEETFDSAGNLRTVGDDAGITATYAYDGMGRKIAAKDGNSIIERYSYDDNGNPCQTRDRNGNLTETVYDYLHRIVKKTDANNMAKSEQQRKSERFVYNYLGKLDSVIDARTNATVFEYDAAGRLTTKTDALGMQYDYQYDCRDLAAKITNPNESTVEMKYSNDGLLVEKSFSQADSLTYFYNYDSTGNLLAVLKGATRASADTQVTREYDKMNRLTREKQHLVAGGKSISYTYDNQGQRKTRIFEGDTIRYSYNNLGQMDSLLLNGSVKATYQYCVCGALEKKSYANGVDMSYERDNARRLTGIYAVNSADDTILSIVYALDDAGNVTKIVRDGDTSDFDYDYNSQLTYAEYDNGLMQQFTYDDAGNRTRLQESGTRSTDVTYTFNDFNQLVSATDGSTWTYDSLGNMIGQSSTGEQQEYFYSPENRLMSVKKNSTTQATYSYDFQGRRNRETSADTMQFAWDGWNNLSDYRANNNLTTSYLTGLDLDDYILVKDSVGGAKKYVIQDRVNSVVGIADSTGALAGWNKYEAFGTVCDSSGMSGIRQAFTGREQGYNDFMYYRMRWYRVLAGAFQTADPIGFAHEQLNIYSYANNNPIVYRDPTGLATQVCRCSLVWSQPTTSEGLYCSSKVSRDGVWKETCIWMTIVLCCWDCPSGISRGQDLADCKCPLYEVRL